MLITTPSSRVGCLLAIALAVAAVLLAIFFFSAFLALFLPIAIASFVRRWWLLRKAKQERSGSVSEGEYYVVDMDRDDPPEGGR